MLDSADNTGVRRVIGLGTANKKAIPSIDLLGATPCQSIDSSSLLREGAKLFLDHGCLLIKNAFEPEFIQKLFGEYIESYKEYFTDSVFENALTVGDKRTMISVQIKGSFNSKEYYANQHIYPLIKFLLNNDFVLGSSGSVVSLPGSKDQHIHRDHPNIYHTHNFYSTNVSVLGLSPPYAITVVIPLVPINELTGSTRLWLDTHLSSVFASDVVIEDGVDYVADLGSCLLMDYRLVHAGRANNSGGIRPIIYNVYNRPWFRDYRNYKKQLPLIISNDQYDIVPDGFKHLFDWCVENDRGASISAKAEDLQRTKPGSRNAPCFCGSGKRFKRCHGTL